MIVKSVIVNLILKILFSNDLTMLLIFFVCASILNMGFLHSKLVLGNQSKCVGYINLSLPFPIASKHLAIIKDQIYILLNVLRTWRKLKIKLPFSYQFWTYQVLSIFCFRETEVFAHKVFVFNPFSKPSAVILKIPNLDTLHFRGNLTTESK